MIRKYFPGNKTSDFDFYLFIRIVNMKSVSLFFICLQLCQLTSCYSKSYKEYKVYSVFCKSRREVEVLKLWESSRSVDFWNRPSISKPSSVLVDPFLQPEFEAFLSSENFNYEILIENVGKLVESSFFRLFRLFNSKVIKIFSRSSM